MYDWVFPGVVSNQAVACESQLQLHGGLHWEDCAQCTPRDLRVSKSDSATDAQRFKSTRKLQWPIV